MQIGTSILIGATPLLIAGVVWVLPHWDLFSKQVLEVGIHHYLGIDHGENSIRQLADFRSPARFIQSWEKWIVLSLAAAVLLRKGNRQLRMVAVMAVASSLPLLFFDNAPQVLAGILGVLLVFHLSQSVGGPRLQSVFWVLSLLLIGSALSKLSLIGLTAAVQHEGRDYQIVKTELTALIRSSDRVAITQEAWLALRDRLPTTHLHLLPHAAPSTENRPIITRSFAALDHFDYLVLQRSKLPALKNVYPWLSPALRSHHFLEIKSIKPNFDSLPWAKLPNYDLVIFARTEATAVNPN